MPLIMRGTGLTIEDVVDVARHGKKIELAPEAIEAIKRCRAMIERKVEAHEVMYGINTGIGELADVALTDDQVQQVESIDPFHLHEADPIMFDKILHIDQVMLLDLCYVGRHMGDACHCLFVAPRIWIAFRRKDLQCQRQCEAVRTATLRQEDNPLTARADPPLQSQVFCPAEPLLAHEGLITVVQIVGAAAICVSVQRDCLGSPEQRRRYHKG